MSFIFCPFYKIMLNDDIKNRILNKIKELQCHSEWNTFDLHINMSHIDTSSINIDDIIKQRNIWENIAKLSIDLWRDFDYYQQFIFKSKFDDDEYKKRLESLGCICEEGVWRSVSRPSEEVVQTSVFMYCLYEMMVKEKMGDIGTVIADKSIICVFCDSEIENREDYCNICSASKEEREKHRKNIDNEQNKQIDNKEDNDKCKINKNDDDISKYEEEEGDKEVEKGDKEVKEGNKEVEKGDKDVEKGVKDVEKGDKEGEGDKEEGEEEEKEVYLVAEEYCEVKIKEVCAVNVENNNINKWKCGRCESMNEYVFGNCKVCSGRFKDGKWNCNNCTMVNSCVDDACLTCNKANFYMKERHICNTCRAFKNGDDKDCYLCNTKNKKTEMKIDNDKWKCGLCGMLQLYNITVCDVCRGSRIINGLWQCTQCSLINKCGDVKCTVCGVMNDNLLIKHCKYCKKNELKEDEVHCGECIKNKCNSWKCPFAHCGEWNVEKDDYCQKCRIYCYSSQSRGMPVKIYNQERYKWICLRCHIYNEINCFACECGESRYRLRDVFFNLILPK